MPDDEMFRPPVNRAMRVLDRGFFQKTVPIAAARITSNKDISLVRKTLEKSKDVLTAPRLASVQPDPLPELASLGRRCVLLRPDVKHDGGQPHARCYSEHALMGAGRPIHLVSNPG